MLDHAVAERRYEALRREMKGAGLDALVLVSRAQPGHRGAIRFVADYHFLVRIVYAVMLPEGEPILVTANRAEQHQAIRASGLHAVEYGVDPAAVVASILEDRLSTVGRVGITGMSATLPLRDLDTLRTRLPDAELVDAMGVLERARAVKSQAEIEQVRSTNAIADAAYRRFLELAGEGVTELEIQAEVERLVRLAGCCEMFTLIAAGPQNVALALPTRRPLEHGDVITFWVEVAGPEGFWVERGGMASLGPPSDQTRMLFEVCLDSMRQGAAALVPGMRASDVAARIKEVAADAGLVLGVWSGHSIGLDVIEAPSIVSDDDGLLEEGMLISLHPHVVTPDRTNGGHTGDVYVVTPGGGAPLSSLAHELHVI